MSKIKIIVNGVELPFVNQDFKYKVPNNSFETSFKVEGTSYPIRLIETIETKNALGQLDINSSNKKRYIPATLQIDNIKYNAVIEQVSKNEKFRKCNIKSQSSLDGIFKTKIHEFFTDVSLFGDPTPEPYKDVTENRYFAFDAWRDDGINRRFLRYPETHWQQPMFYHKDFFTPTNEAPINTYENYTGSINHRNVFGELVANGLSFSADFVDVRNVTVFSPQVFMLSPILLAVQSIGYSLKGSFAEDDFMKSVLLHSTAHNMSEFTVKSLADNISFENINFIFQTLTGEEAPAEQNTWHTYTKTIYVTQDTEGSFRIDYDFLLQTELSQDNYSGFIAIWEGEKVGEYFSYDVAREKESINFTVDSANVGNQLKLIFHHRNQINPIQQTIEIRQDVENEIFLDAHPTIEFKRYLPDWTLIEYLNNLKNIFNLKIDVDEIKKELTINYNEEDYLINGEATRLTKGFKLKSFNNVEAENFALKFDNELDNYVVYNNGILLTNGVIDDTTSTIKNKFKYIPELNNTGLVNEDIANRNGIGLMLYNPARQPYVSHMFNGRTLSLVGAGSITEQFWKRWFKFKVNAANPTAEGAITKTQLDFIMTTKKCIINNQTYLISNADYKDASNGLVFVTLELKSINY